MKNIPFLFICLFLLVISGFSQTNSADSIKSILKYSVGIKRIDLLNTLAWEIKYQNTSEAFAYAGEALSLSDKLNYSKGKAESSKNLAALYLLTNNSKEALNNANKGIVYSSAIHDSFTLAKLFNLKALVFEDRSEYTQAITFFKKSCKLFEQIGNQEETSGILNNLAILYGRINQLKLQLETYHKVLTYEEKAGNKLGLARTYNNIAEVYNSLGDQKSAMNLYKKGLSLSRQVSSVRFEAAALNGIGLIYRDQKKYDSALYFIQEAAKLNRKNSYIQWLANNFINIGGIYLFNISDGGKGEKYIRDAASIYYSINDWSNYVLSLNVLCEWYLTKDDKQHVSKILASADRFIDSTISDNVKLEYFKNKYQYYKSTGNISQALKSLELSNALGDTIAARQQIQESFELQAKYDLSHQEQENEKLRVQTSMKEETIHHQRIVIASIFIISTLLVFIALLLLRSRRKISKINKALHEISQQILEKASDLEMENESKDKFLSIISHDLKNPINAVTGLSDLLLDQSMELSDEDKNKYIRYINEGCLSADQLLENLMKWVRSQTGKLEMKPVEFDLSKSVENAISLAQNAAIRKEISIKSEVPSNLKVFADPEMISTCLLNLVTNAVKFTPNNGQITIKPDINGRTINVNVIDSGVGISPENIQNLFRLDTKSGTLGTANEKGTGLGLLLVKEFIEKNNGKVKVESTLGKGSTFTLMIPKKRPKTEPARVLQS